MNRAATYCLALCLLLSLVWAGGAAAHNPFLAAPGGAEQANATSLDVVRQPDAAPEAAAPVAGVGAGLRDAEAQGAQSPVAGGPILGAFYTRLARWQGEVRLALTGAIKDVKRSPTPGAAALFLALSFFYGLLHAAGPGHGKTIAASYFMTRRGTVGLGLLLGGLTALFHALSASVLVLAASVVLKRSVMTTFDEAGQVLEKGSYGLIALVGAVLLVRTVWPAKTADNEAAAAACGRGVLSAALATGVVPCPGAALILFFAISQDMLYFGMVSVLAMALGMGVTIAGVGVLTIRGRGRALRLVADRPWARGVHTVLEVGGALVVLGLGLVLFLG